MVSFRWALGLQFGYIGGGPDIKALFHIPVRIQGTEDNHRDTPGDGIVLQLGAEAEPVQTGHFHIGDDQVETPGKGLLQPLQSVFRLGNPCPEFLQLPGQGLADNRAIINDEYLW